MTERWVAVLGRRDEPTDAVEEYCLYLGDALAKQGVELNTVRLRWAEIGWEPAITELQEKLLNEKPSWLFLQYTALAWSERGFPLKLVKAVRPLKQNGPRCAVVFHDPDAYPGTRLVDRFRRMIQLRVMRAIVRTADLTVLTISAQTIHWLPNGLGKVVSIPVGANLPNPEAAWGSKHDDDVPTVAVYSISSGGLGGIEAKRVARAVRFVSSKIGRVRLCVLGRNSESAGQQLKEELAGTTVELVIYGLLKPEDVSRVLGGCDVLLFARGPISTRRGSALAGVACGLPVVAWEGWETAPPITEAGVLLVPENEENTLGAGLLKVLTDDQLRESLRARSRFAQSQYFSWGSIAAQYLATLRDVEEAEKDNP